MALFINQYITEYDESLSTDSYIDPVGMLIIWSAFGRQVFNNRVNSISNDVRNYTLNLFHHFLVRKLVDDDSATLSHSLKQKYHGKDVLHFKQACLIFLENLFVYSALRHENEKAVEAAGILGISNARRRWSNDSDKVIVFTHEPAGQILVRQLGLGVSGRYKTPLMDIGFFDTNYQYHKPAFQSHWADAQELIAGNPKSLLGKLEQVVYPFLKEFIAALGHGGKLKFSDKAPKKLTEAYARAFASPRVVGSYARDFWLKQTGLDRGAAGALFEVLEKNFDDQPSPQQVLEKAQLKQLPAADKAKLDHIAFLEPFLSDCTLLFTLMAAERTHSVAAVEEHWARFGRDVKCLPDLALQVSGHASLPAVNGTEAARRLTRLRQVAVAGGFEQQVRALASYHQTIMQSRGQLSWLAVDHDGTIRVSARTLPRPKPEDWPPGAWYNPYYLPQFTRFVMGLQGLGT